MEEIIIDGVDVAGCEYMLNNKIKGKQHCPVKAMPYAKETSCICRKSIDTPYNFCKHNPNCHYKQLKRLEQENTELKVENELLREENLVEQTQYTEVVSENVQKIRQLKQTLQEIKAIAKSAMAKQQEYKKDFEQILDLITKAEEE